MLCAVGLIAGCGGGDDELTVSEQLEKAVGRPLTSTEVAEQIAIADELCRFDRVLLVEIWARLDSSQLEFQDFVFGQHCPRRLDEYTELRPSMGTVPEAERTTSTPPIADRDLIEVLESVGSDGVGPAAPRTERSPTPTTTAPTDDAG